jgi:UDP-N-acetylmuramate--alanine ligase
MHIHFSGIGGVGISGLAQFCQSLGFFVQGSDGSPNGQPWDALISKNIKLFTQQRAENITKNLDLVVYSEAVPLTNPELVRARELHISTKTYFEYLGELSADYTTIAVAGTHGKTTTVGLTAAGLQSVDFPATILVGSTLNEFNGSNFQPGTNKFLIVEACEYRENFRFLQSDIVVLTSLEWDHPDSFPTEESYFKAFAKFISKAKTVIYHADEPHIDQILKNFSGEQIAVPSQSDNSLQYLIKIFGAFNERNALLSMALAKKLGLKLGAFKQGLSQYSGAGRRQEILGKKNGVKFYDDYAHHPTEISELLRAFRVKFPDSKIGIIYEPHQHSRTKEFFLDFIDSFSYADAVALYPIYAARDTDEDKLFGIEKFVEADPSFSIVDDQVSIKEFCQKFTTGDVVIFCGAGKISAVGREFLKVS